mmetsp:Transcript_24016/g.71829  ORF Transcript_24016/g.71829 Transcript_24016/m.71829 type:complete len:152 (-) Transcript_24016:154-609(-)
MNFDPAGLEVPACARTRRAEPVLVVDAAGLQHAGICEYAAVDEERALLKTQRLGAHEIQAELHAALSASRSELRAARHECQLLRASRGRAEAALEDARRGQESSSRECRALREQLVRTSRMLEELQVVARNQEEELAELRLQASERRPRPL